MQGIFEDFEKSSKSKPRTEENINRRNFSEIFFKIQNKKKEITRKAFKIIGKVYNRKKKERIRKPFLEKLKGFRA